MSTVSAMGVIVLTEERQHSLYSKRFVVSDEGALPHAVHGGGRLFNLIKLILVTYLRSSESTITALVSACKVLLKRSLQKPSIFLGFFHFPSECLPLTLIVSTGGGCSLRTL